MVSPSRQRGARRPARVLAGFLIAVVVGLALLVHFLSAPQVSSAAQGFVRDASESPPAAARAEPAGLDVVPAIPRDALQAEASTRTALSAESGPPLAAWSGRVVDATQDSPVAEARVVLRLGEHETATVSDSDGRFELSWPGDTAAQLTIEHPSYVDVRAPAADLSSPGLFRLTRSARIRGWVRPFEAEQSGRAMAWRQTANSQRYWQPREVAVGGDGGFEFADLDPGEYVLGALVPGRAVAPEAGLRLESGDEQELTLVAGAGARLEGRVLLDGGTRGVEGARLSLEPRDDSLPRDWRSNAKLEGTSDESGRFAFEGLATGNWQVEVVTAWAASASRDLVVSETGEVLRVEMSVGGPASIAGQVVDAQGKPLEGIEVLAVPRGRVGEFLFGSGDAQARSDASGGFRIAEVPSGDALQVAARSASPAGEAAPCFAVEYVLPLASGEARTGLILSVLSGRTLAGVVLTPDGLAVPGARVDVNARLEGRRTRAYRTETDATGRFEVRDLPGEQAAVTANAEGWLATSTQVEAGVTEVELRLQAAWTLSGQALDEQRFGVPGLAIQLEWIDPQAGDRQRRSNRTRNSTQTDEYGRFSLAGLRTGTWRLSTDSNEWRPLGTEPLLVELPAESELTLLFARRARPQPATITGQVVLAGGATPTGVRVEGLRGGVLTIDAGRFRASGVTPTSQRLAIRADGHAAARLAPIDLTPGNLYDVGQVELEPATLLSVNVREKGSGSVSGARVRLESLPVEEGGAGQGVQAVNLESQGRGRYVTPDATRHVWRLVVAREGYRRFARTVEILDQARQSVDVELELE